MEYEWLVKAQFADSWQKTFQKALLETTPKQRHGSLSGPHDNCSLVFIVSPKTRLELYAWKSYAARVIMQHPDVPDHEVHIARIDRDVIEKARRDAENQPVMERWERAYVIAGYPGAYENAGMRQVYGHLHHHEVTNAR